MSERAPFNYEPQYEPEEQEPSVDLRSEGEIFGDHERLGATKDEDAIAKLKDTLAEEVGGILHISIPDYDYVTTHNPFVGMGPRVKRIYQIARYLDVTFLHRFMYHDILVTALRSRDFAGEPARAGFIKRIRETGGEAINLDANAGYDFKALKFSPYVASDSTAAIFEQFHKQEPHASQVPHYPVDVWLVYDLSAYEVVPGGSDGQEAYALKPGYDRHASLLAVAQIN